METIVWAQIHIMHRATASSLAPDLYSRPESLVVLAAALLPLLLLVHSLWPRKQLRTGAESWRQARVVKNVVPLMGRSPSLPPPSAPPKPVDLTGSWLNTAIRGDFRAYMVAMGAPYLVRTRKRVRLRSTGESGLLPDLPCALPRPVSTQVQQAAKFQDYGIGKMRNVVSKQTRSHLSLETNFPFVHNIDLE